MPLIVVETEVIGSHQVEADREIRSTVRRETEITPSTRIETGLRTEFRVQAIVVLDLVSRVLRADHLEVPLEVLLVEECAVVV